MKNSAFIVFTISLLSLSASSQGSVSTLKNVIKPKVIDSIPKVVFDSINFAKTSEMLEEDFYWAIIDKSLKETNNLEDQEIFLTKEIENLSPKEMIGFRLRTDKLLFDSYNSDLWCASYIINSGGSEDGFAYFRCWLISRGKEVYYQSKSSPDYLINVIAESKNVYEFEGFWYVAVSAFNNKTNQELYNYVDTEKFVTNDENYPLLNFNWNIDNPESMGKICPLLFKKFWKK